MTDEVQNEEAGATEAKVDKRSKMIIDPEGNEVKRTDYIRKLWADGNMTRGEIRDHLKNECSAENGENEIAYQIVFAATKNLEGGPSEAELERRKAEKEAAKAAKKKAADDAGEEVEDDDFEGDDE